MTATILLDLLKANLAAGVAVLAVLAIRSPVRPRFGAQAAYLLWIAPLAAGLAALVPHPAARTMMAPVVASASAAVSEFVATAPAAVTRAGPDLASLALALWGLGVAVTAVVLLRRQAAFLSAMGRVEPTAGGVFRAERAGVGPAVVGVLRPRIVTPADFETRFGPEERALILAHEGVHLRRGDAAVNALACAAQCLCWFNPLAHLAARLLRIDQELACDASVIDRFPGARRTYAELLLKTQLATQPLPLGCHWPARAEHPLKARIAMLTSPLPEAAMRGMGLAVAAALTLGAGGLAWASQPGAVAASQPAGPGPEERQEAQARNALHPSYSCDRVLELSGGGCKIIQVPVWLALPTHADMMRQYPPAALKAGVTAEVAVHCEMTGDGLLTACAAGETQVKAPGGAAVDDSLRAAFAAAAVAVSRYYQFAIPGRVPTAGLGRSRANLKIVFDPNSTGREFPPGPPGSTPARAPTPASAGRGDLSIARGAVAADASRPAIQRVSRATETEAAPEARLAAFLQSPNWSRRPTVEDLVRAYPAEAVRANIEGDVVLHCQVAADGRLADCSVLRETPPGAGFGAAALKLTPLFEAREQTPQGGPKRGTDIRIPIRFRLPTPPPA